MYRREWAGTHTAALVATLFFTLPNTGQNRYVQPNPDSPADSLRVECIGGPAIHGLRTAYLWGQPLRGGGFAVIDSHTVAGKEGTLDSFRVAVSGNYYVTTRNGVGNSCAPSLPVTVLLENTLTDVPASPAADDPVVSWTLFSPLGARVREFRASGVYFAKLVRRSGRTDGQKVPFVRGIGPLVRVRDWYTPKMSR
jgi:hypothetical protein